MLQIKLFLLYQSVTSTNIYVVFTWTDTGAGDAPLLNHLLVPSNIAIGDNTEILCTIKRGSSPFEFKWLHNGHEVQTHSKYKTSSSQTSSHIFIGAIQASDIGNFTCVATNAYGEDSKTENVFMEGMGIFLVFRNAVTIYTCNFWGYKIPYR